MVPFLAFDTEIRKIVCTTNAIESLNARFRRAVNARGHFPTEQTLLANSGDYVMASAARWETRLRPKGLPASHASSRVRLIAVAVRMFCTRALAIPL
jgi:transposase-like protein